MCTFVMMPLAALVGAQVLLQERLQINVAQYNLLISTRGVLAMVFGCISPWLLRKLGLRQAHILIGVGTLFGVLLKILAIWLSSYLTLAFSCCFLQCFTVFSTITSTSMNVNLAQGDEQSKVASLNLIY